MKDKVRYVCILRAINVGGHRVVLMDDLKEVLEGVGFVNVRTYIQSGNVVFDADNKINGNNIGPMITEALSKKYDFDIPIIVRRGRQFQKTLEKNPFIEEKNVDINKLYVTLLKEYPLSINKEEMLKLDYSPDEFVVDGRAVFIKYAGKFSDSRLNNKLIENTMKVPATTRNWKTCQAIAALVDED